MEQQKMSDTSILDLPDEILVKIISHFKARNRLAIADSCSRFNSLIFNDEELMRDLDFSKHGHLISAEDVLRYFREEKSCLLVRKVNIQDVNCIRYGRQLSDTIGKAINLVDVNINGVRFRDTQELGSFLTPLTNLKRLSVHWPKSKEEPENCRKILQKPLARLSFFSVKLFMYSVEFLPNIKLCHELEELHIITTASHRHMRRMSWDLEPSKLTNLKIVRVRGTQAMQMKIHLINLIPDPQAWTDFQLIDVSREPGFYLEKNVEVCKELRETSVMKSIPYQRENPAFDIGWFLIAEHLLKTVIEITHDDVIPEKFCCLTANLKPLEQDKEPCLIKIVDAKRLLKDPKDQISLLYFKHSIEENCDAHLVASAFPNLTELVLCDIITKKLTPRETNRNLRKRLTRRRDMQHRIESMDTDYSSSATSFEILIENTPNLTDLTIHAQNEFDKQVDRWDLKALSCISRWKNLRTLRLAFVPIKDGKFLIDIGRECSKLKTVILHHLKNYATTDLVQMLRNCKNLKELCIRENFLENIPEVVASVYANNTKLKKLILISSDTRHKSYKLGDLISSIEKLLISCPKLNTLVFILKPLLQEDANELTTALRRMRIELNRPSFRFQTIENRHKSAKTETIYEDNSSFSFSSKPDGYCFE